MSAATDAAPSPLTKVDSAVQGLSSSPPKETKRRASSSVPGVFNINDLEKEGKELLIAEETQKLNWRINKSPLSLDEPEKNALKKMLTTPPVKKIDLHFPLGLEVTARNLRGVTIKDALDAIYKQFRKKVSPLADLILPPPSALALKQGMPATCTARPRNTLTPPLKADDELETPVLAGFEWDKEESWTRLVVHCKKEGAPQPKKKAKKGQEATGGDEL